MKQKRDQERAQWESEPKQLQWRENLKAMDIVDVKTYDGVWKLGQVLTVGNDPNLLLVTANNEHMRNLQYFSR